MLRLIGWARAWGLKIAESKYYFCNYEKLTKFLLACLSFLLPRASLPPRSLPAPPATCLPACLPHAAGLCQSTDACVLQLPSLCLDKYGCCILYSVCTYLALLAQLTKYTIKSRNALVSPTRLISEFHKFPSRNRNLFYSADPDLLRRMTHEN